MGTSRLKPAIALVVLFAAMLALVFTRMAAVEAKADWSEQVLESPTKIAQAQEVQSAAEKAIEKAADAGTPENQIMPVKTLAAETEQRVADYSQISEYLIEKDVPESSPIAALIDPLATGDEDVEYEALVPNNYAELANHYEAALVELENLLPRLEAATITLAEDAIQQSEEIQGEQSEREGE